jgi:hypothetical protein
MRGLAPYAWGSFLLYKCLLTLGNLGKRKSPERSGRAKTALFRQALLMLRYCSTITEMRRLQYSGKSSEFHKSVYYLEEGTL